MTPPENTIGEIDEFKIMNEIFRTLEEVKKFHFLVAITLNIFYTLHHLWLIHTAWVKSYRKQDLDQWSPNMLYRSVHTGPRQERNLDPVLIQFPVSIQVPFPYTANKLLELPLNNSLTVLGPLSRPSSPSSSWASVDGVTKKLNRQGISIKYQVVSFTRWFVGHEGHKGCKDRVWMAQNATFAPFTPCLCTFHTQPLHPLSLAFVPFMSSLCAQSLQPSSPCCCT